MKLNKKLKKTRKTLKVEVRRVIILGAGEVGGHIAQCLAAEGYNVILIDQDEDKIKNMRFLADIGTYLGNACDPKVYLDINLNEKDVFIAVTSSDEVNLIACHIAKVVGCGIKVARVRNHFYKDFNDDTLGHAFWRKLGVEVLFNQDEITSVEILKLIESPGSVEVIDLGDSDIQLVAYRVGADSLLCGRRLIGLKDVPIFNNTLTVAVVRSHVHQKYYDSHRSPVHIKAPTAKSFHFHSKKTKKNMIHQKETLIPKGDFSIQEGDILYISGLKKDFKSIGHLFDSNNDKKLKHIFILGGNSLAILLACELIKKYPRKDIYLVIKDEKDAFAIRDQITSKIHVLRLDLHDMNGLMNEGLDECCIFIGASKSEDDNVLACLLVKEETQAKTVAIVQNNLYNHVMPYMEIDIVVSSKILLVEDVLKVLRKNICNVLFSKGEDSEVLEFTITKNFTHLNKALRDIRLPEDSILAAVSRQGKMFVPKGSTFISLDDHVIVFCLKHSIKEVQNFFIK